MSDHQGGTSGLCQRAVHLHFKESLLWFIWTQCMSREADRPETLADKDGNGSIDMEELEHCFKELQVDCTRDEVRAFHEESDMDSSHAIEFKEFIVVLALIYLLGTPSSTSEHQNTVSSSAIS